jgi:hypothetical protein
MSPSGVSGTVLHSGGVNATALTPGPRISSGATALNGRCACAPAANVPVIISQISSHRAVGSIALIASLP